MTAYTLPMDEKTFAALLKNDPDFGIKAAVACGVLDSQLAGNLSGEQKTLFCNYNILQLLGCRITVDSRSPAERAWQKFESQSGFQGPVYRESAQGQGNYIYYEKYTGSNVLSVEDVLALSSEDIQRTALLHDKGIFKLVKSRNLPFQRALRLSGAEFERLRYKTREALPFPEWEKSPTGKHPKDYGGFFTNLYSEDPQNIEILLRFLAAIPDDYWPKAPFIRAAFDASRDNELSEEDGFLAVATLPVPVLKILEETRNEYGDGGYDALERLIAMAQAVTNYGHDDEGRLKVEVVHYPVLHIKELADWPPEKVKMIGLAGNAVRCGLLSLDEAAALDEERARVAHELAGFILYRQHPDLKSMDISEAHMHSFSLQQAKAVKKLSFLLGKNLAATEDLAVFAGNFRMLELIHNHQGLIIVLLEKYGPETLSLMSDIRQDGAHNEEFLALWEAIEGIDGAEGVFSGLYQPPESSKLQALYDLLSAASANPVPSPEEPAPGM